MRHVSKAIRIWTCMILATMFNISQAYAFTGGGSPSQPPGSPPYGMAIHGDVAGTKLNGTFQMHFSLLFCSKGPTLCNLNGPDSAMAKATLRLRKGNILKSFLMDFGAVPIDDIATLQAAVMDGFKNQIISAFFTDDPSTMSMYLKELSEFSMDYIYNPNASPGTYIVDPLDPDQRKIVEFIAISDVVVAVK